MSWGHGVPLGSSHHNGAAGCGLWIWNGPSSKRGPSQASEEKREYTCWYNLTYKLVMEMPSSHLGSYTTGINQLNISSSNNANMKGRIHQRVINVSLKINVPVMMRCHDLVRRIEITQIKSFCLAMNNYGNNV